MMDRVNKVRAECSCGWKSEAYEAKDMHTLAGILATHAREHVEQQTPGRFDYAPC